MRQFKAFDKNVEVLGQAVLSIVDGMKLFRKRALMIIAENGIVDLQPDRWYPQQYWLNAFQVIAERIGPHTLYQIGLRIPENAAWQEGIDSLSGALASIDEAYHRNHRGGEIGSYRFTELGERKAVIVCDNPYPCDFDWGIIRAIADKFKPPAVDWVDIRHDETKPCRKKGGESCTYRISW